MKTLVAFFAVFLCANVVSAAEILRNSQLKLITAGGATATATADAYGTHASSTTTAITEVRAGGGMELKPGASRELLEQFSVGPAASATASRPAALRLPSASGRVTSAASLITQFGGSR